MFRRPIRIFLKGLFKTNKKHWCTVRESPVRLIYDSTDYLRAFGGYPLPSCALDESDPPSDLPSLRESVDQGCERREVTHCHNRYPVDILWYTGVIGGGQGGPRFIGAIPGDVPFAFGFHRVRRRQTLYAPPWHHGSPYPLSWKQMYLKALHWRVMNIHG